jgi:predicted  nucleic acid-binding Zn-ribbon protein
MSDLTTLIAVEEEIANVLAIVDELAEGEHEIAWSYLDELRLTEIEAIDGIGRAVRKRQSEIDFLRNEETRLKSRRQAAEKRLAEFREYLSQLFQESDIRKVKGQTTTAYLRKSISVDVEDISQLPSEFVRTELQFVPEKTRIKDALKNGQEVPGVKLVEKQNLVLS